MAKIADMNEKIAQTVTERYKKIEDAFTGQFLEEDGSLKTGRAGAAVTQGYKKIEEGVVEGFNKVSDKFIDVLFAKEGETVEQARARMQKTVQDMDTAKSEVLYHE